MKSETDSPKSVFLGAQQRQQQQQKINFAVTQLINSHSALSVPFIVNLYEHFFGSLAVSLIIRKQKKNTFYLSTSSSLLAVYYNSIMSTNAHFLVLMSTP